MTICKNPKCRKELERNPNKESSGGRPKEHCGKRCRDAHYRHRAKLKTLQDADRYAGSLKALFDDLARYGGDMSRAMSIVDGAQRSVYALTSVNVLTQRVQDLEAIAVQSARDNGLTGTRIAGLLDIGPRRLRDRWPTAKIERQIARSRSRAISRATPAAPDERTSTPDGSPPSLYTLISMRVLRPNPAPNGVPLQRFIPTPEPLRRPPNNRHSGGHPAPPTRPFE